MGVHDSTGFLYLSDNPIVYFRGFAATSSWGVAVRLSGYPIGLPLAHHIRNCLSSLAEKSMQKSPFTDEVPRELFLTKTWFTIGPRSSTMLCEEEASAPWSLERGAEGVYDLNRMSTPALDNHDHCASDRPCECRC